MCAEPEQQLALFQEARRLGSSHPNLRVWSRAFWAPDELSEWISQLERQQQPDFPDQ
jgi:hypothetical protein